jgi:hypothetical protein
MELVRGFVPDARFNVAVGLRLGGETLRTAINQALDHHTRNRMVAQALADYGVPSSSPSAASTPSRSGRAWRTWRRAAWTPRCWTRPRPPGPSAPGDRRGPASGELSAGEAAERARRDPPGRPGAERRDRPSADGLLAEGTIQAIFDKYGVPYWPPAEES